MNKNSNDNHLWIYDRTLTQLSKQPCTETLGMKQHLNS